MVSAKNPNQDSSHTKKSSKQFYVDLISSKKLGIHNASFPHNT